MSNEFTEIVLVVDESGSMGTIRQDTIGGLNSFLEDQKQLEGKANLTVVTFSNTSRVVVDGKDVREVEPFTTANYRPTGGTALLDAIGDTINRLEDRYTDEADASKIPARVIFAIVTDGEENTSRNYTKSQIAKMIKHQVNRHGWEFAFLGANLDAVAEARSIGIVNNAYNFSASGQGAKDSFAVLSNATLSYRSAGVATYDVAGTSLEGMNIGSQQAESIVNLSAAPNVKIEISGDGSLTTSKIAKAVNEAITANGSFTVNSDGKLVIPPGAPSR